MRKPGDSLEAGVPRQLTQREARAGLGAAVPADRQGKTRDVGWGGPGSWSVKRGFHVYGLSCPGGGRATCRSCTKSDGAQSRFTQILK